MLRLDGALGLPLLPDRDPGGIEAKDFNWLTGTHFGGWFRPRRCDSAGRCSRVGECRLEDH